MSNYFIAINPDKPINNVTSTTLKTDIQNSEIDPSITDFFNDKTRNITKVFEKQSKSVDVPDLNRRNIRLTLDTTAIRSNLYDSYSGKFDPGYPLNSNYIFCPQRLTSVFNYAKQQSSKYIISNGYPTSTNRSIINSLNLNFFDCDTGGITPPIVICEGVTCEDPQVLDIYSCGCVSPPMCLSPVELEDCELTELPGLKSPIYGYAFYVDEPRPLSIPDIEETVTPSCYSGHVCNRTFFSPKIQLADDTIISADRNICLDNAIAIDPSDLSLLSPNDGSQILPPGFAAATIAERADSFTITFDPLTQDLEDARFFLECAYPECHGGVTFVVLVAETIDTDEKIIIFKSCIFPGAVSCKLLGTIDCTSATTFVECSDSEETPPPQVFYDCELYSDKFGEDKLSIIQTWKNNITTEIDISQEEVYDLEYCSRIVKNDDLNRVYVGAYGPTVNPLFTDSDPYIIVLDGSSNDLIHTINLSDFPGGTSYIYINDMTIYNNKLYVVMYFKIFIIDCITHTLIGTFDPFYVDPILGLSGFFYSIAIDPVSGIGYVGGRAYRPNYVEPDASIDLFIFDANTDTILTTLENFAGIHVVGPVTSYGIVNSIVVDTLTNLAYCLVDSPVPLSNEIIKIIDSTGTLIASINIPINSISIVLDSDNRRGYISSQYNITVIDLDSNTIVDPDPESLVDTIPIPLIANPTSMVINLLTNRLYVAGNGYMHSISTITNQVVKTISGVGNQLCLGSCVPALPPCE